jgi:hypothetical protein
MGVNIARLLTNASLFALVRDKSAGEWAARPNDGSTTGFVERFDEHHGGSRR